MDPPPRGWEEHAWTIAVGNARRALQAERLARESYPPNRVGYVAFNQARGRIMATLDRQANTRTNPQVRVIESGAKSDPGVREHPGSWPQPAEEAGRA